MYGPRPTQLFVQVVRLFRLAKLVRLLRASRIFRHIRDLRQFVEETLRVSLPVWMVKIFSLVALMVLSGHWLGSILFMIAKLGDFPEGSWATVIAGEPAATQCQ